VGLSRLFGGRAVPLAVKNDPMGSKGQAKQHAQTVKRWHSSIFSVKFSSASMRF